MMGIKGYKAFSKGMKCKDKQYEENTTYEEDGKKICSAGVMHFCENPFDVLDYYPLVDENGEIPDFAEVEALGNVYKDGTKSASNKLHIGLKLGLKEFVKACVDFTIEKTKHDNEFARTLEDNPNDSGESSNLASSGAYSNLASSGACSNLASSGAYSNLASSGACSNLASSGESSNLASSGAYSNLASSGESSKLASSGACSNLASSGAYSNLASSGESSKLASSGESSKLASSGAYSNLASSGESSKLASSGACSNLASSGAYSNLASSGAYSIVMAAGIKSIAKAKIGSWITLAEWVEKDDKWIPEYVKTEYVDGDRIKEDTFYKLENHEFVEIKESEE